MHMESLQVHGRCRVVIKRGVVGQRSFKNILIIQKTVTRKRIEYFSIIPFLPSRPMIQTYFINFLKHTELPIFRYHNITIIRP